MRLEKQQAAMRLLRDALTLFGQVEHGASRLLAIGVVLSKNVLSSRCPSFRLLLIYFLTHDVCKYLLRAFIQGLYRVSTFHVYLYMCSFFV